jgi:tRNA-2-methylthio-N6-dimethylallyladenosine synthase
MAERLGDILKHEIPGVDEVIGAKSMENIEGVLNTLVYGQHTDSENITEKNKASDFVSIMRGCDNYCAYCIVPYVRGPEISLPATAIVEKVRKKVDEGIKEITLLGQNVNSYSDSGTDFPDLLSKVAEVEGIERVRFTTSHPKDCSEKLVGTMANEKKCCRHIHLPVQAGADRVLSLMNRRYGNAEYRDRVAMIRAYLPDADITTDILVGFPSETEKEYGETLALVKDIRFTTAFMFAYSVREGTTAALMKDTIPKSIKQRRLRELIDLQTGITKKMYAGMTGREVHLLVTGRQERRDRLWMARDNGCKRALLACDDCKAGMILTARVVQTTGMTLICERTLS